MTQEETATMLNQAAKDGHPLAKLAIVYTQLTNETKEAPNQNS